MEYQIDAVLCVSGGFALNSVQVRLLFSLNCLFQGVYKMCFWLYIGFNR